LDLQEYKNLKYNKPLKGPLHRGVVENNNDPRKLGRVQVRIFGIHTDNKKYLSTKNLPWCDVAVSANFGLITGIGISSTLENGTYVWLLFEDDDYNTPVIIGAISGIYTNISTGKGFNDPNLNYPIYNRINESDYNRLARNENYNKTVLSTFRDSDLTSYSVTGINGTNWDEPEGLNVNTEYPYNKVIETSSGHIIEIDDTKNNERIHIYHKSGSSIELRPDGSISTRIQKNDYKRVKNNMYRGIDGNLYIRIKKNTVQEIDGDSTRTVHQNDYVNVDGIKNTIVTGDYTLKGSMIYLN